MTAATRFINRITSWLFTSQPRQHNSSHGPLLGPGLCRNYTDIFRTLALIPYHNTVSNTATTPPTTPFQIHYHVWKPSSSSTTFKKSHPPTPDFRVSVVDARSTSVPTMTQIGQLLDSTPLDPLPKDKKMEMRLKHGSRNVILAVVDCGLVSYLRMADARFGSEGKVFEEKVRRGAKGGRARGGGRGRGRGRGGGGNSGKS